MPREEKITVSYFSMIYNRPRLYYNKYDKIRERGYPLFPIAHYGENALMFQ